MPSVRAVLTPAGKEERMEQGFVKVAAVTPKIKVADPSYNAEVICRGMEEACGRGAKIIVFPELCLTGYTCGDYFLQQLLLEEASAQLLRVAEATRHREALVMVGLPVEREGRLYNVAAVLCKGWYPKQIFRPTQNFTRGGILPRETGPQYPTSWEEKQFLSARTFSLTVRMSRGSRWDVRSARTSGWPILRELIMP